MANSDPSEPFFLSALATRCPALDGKEWHKLLDSIPTETARDLRDRALLIATLTYSFARITAALRMKVNDLRPKGAGWQILLHEKGGKEHVIPCHLPASPKTAKAGCFAPAPGTPQRC